MGMNEQTMSSVASFSSSGSVEDDELTNLTWLQDQNLLQNFSPNTASTTGRDEIGDDNEILLPGVNSIRLDPSAEINNNGNNSDKEMNMDSNLSACSVPPVTYNPRVHVHTKPPYSFSSLIFMAIESSTTKALPVKDIYAWILDNFPYYQTAPDGWKNTVRHNLSLNKCFQKVDKSKSPTKPAKEPNDSSQLAVKGSLWCVDPFSRPNLLEAVKKTPAHIYPYMSTAKGSGLLQIADSLVSQTPTMDNSNSSTASNTSSLNNSTINADASKSSSTLVISGDDDQSPSKQPVSNCNKLNGTQTSKKLIAIEKLPKKKLLPLLPKRVLIPIGKVGRESEEADVAESMLTLTQCNSASLNNGNIYIITNKNDNLLSSNLILSSSATIAADDTILADDFNPSFEHNYFSKTTNQENGSQPVASTELVVEDGAIHEFTIQNEEQVLDRNLGQEVTVKSGRRSQTKQSDTSPDENDEDGLKCAEALYNLANAGTIKVSSIAAEEELVTTTVIGSNKKSAGSKPVSGRSSKHHKDKPVNKKVKTT